MRAFLGGRASLPRALRLYARAAPPARLARPAVSSKGATQPVRELQRTTRAAAVGSACRCLSGSTQVSGDDVQIGIEDGGRSCNDWEALAIGAKQDATTLLSHLRKADAVDLQVLARLLADTERAVFCCSSYEQVAAVPVELSLLLCDDAHIAELNATHRGKDGPTDVLSFEAESPPGYPLQLLGDVVISVDTAARQAQERGCSLEAEVRVLLLHGILHLLGYDHEAGQAEAQKMANFEQSILADLGWQGDGLVTAASNTTGDGSEANLHDGEQIDSEASSSTSFEIDTTSTQPSPSKRRASEQPVNIKLLALDMDGTLLDSQSQVLASSVEAIKLAIKAGTRVCLATGKARPAAVTAMARVGLAGDGLVISSRGPGLFLQGLAVHGADGTLLEGPNLPKEVVRRAFEYSQELQTPLAAFLGDECVTLQLHPELEELHYRYYEPLCRVVNSLEALLSGPPVKKLLFMTGAEQIAQQHQPFWKATAENLGAETTMAVPNMLEIVPRGINKWVGMQLLLRDLGITKDSLMACGDGANDLQLVSNAGVGIAMGNAVPQVKEAAKEVVASNDDGGIAEAIERFILT